MFTDVCEEKQEFINFKLWNFNSDNLQVSNEDNVEKKNSFIIMVPCFSTISIVSD